MALDPVHLAMTCEYASFRKRTPCTRALRKILSKFSAVDETLNAGAWGHFFNGCRCPELTAMEVKFRNQIEDRSMHKSSAEKILANLDATTPFYLRVEWAQSLAALVSVYREDVDRVAPGPNRRIWQLLHTATAPDRSEWYFNKIRLRHSIPTRWLSLLPIGTTSNEALHHEVNCWFRETQKIHQSSLKMKLRILRLAKLMSHNSAMYHSTSRQLPPAIVLARASSQVLWTQTEWKLWCRALAVEGRIQKAELPIERSRMAERAAVSATVRKRPSSKMQLPNAKRRRTPHTLLRKDSLRRGGVRANPD